MKLNAVVRHVRQHRHIQLNRSRLSDLKEVILVTSAAESQRQLFRVIGMQPSHQLVCTVLHPSTGEGFYNVGVVYQLTHARQSASAACDEKVRAG